MHHTHRHIHSPPNELGIMALAQLVRLWHVVLLGEATSQPTGHCQVDMGYAGWGTGLEDSGVRLAVRLH